MGVKDPARPHDRSKARQHGPATGTAHAHFLASHPDGALPGEIAKALNTFASNATRDLANLRIAGLAVTIDGRWHCSPKLVDLLRQHDWT